MQANEYHDQRLDPLQNRAPTRDRHARSDRDAECAGQSADDAITRDATELVRHGPPSTRAGPRSAIVVQQDLHRRGVEIVELARTHCPEEGPQRQHQHHEPQRDQKIEDVHTCTTSSELADMPSAAIHGWSQPVAASGTAVAF
jgi:hypothetical protein